MADVSFKNGHFVVESMNSPCYLLEMDDTYPTVTGHGTFNKVIGYRRFGAVLIDWFYDNHMVIQEKSVKDALQYIYVKGWDLDSRTANHPNTPIENISIKISQDISRCDCGGTKCKLPCVDWCSTRRSK